MEAFMKTCPENPNLDKIGQFAVFTRVISHFFFSLAAEKSGCIKYADFPAFGPRNAPLSLFAFF
jgi:hypothetical protein